MPLQVTKLVTYRLKNCPTRQKCEIKITLLQTLTNFAEWVSVRMESGHVAEELLVLQNAVLRLQLEAHFAGG